MTLSVGRTSVMMIALVILAVLVGVAAYFAITKSYPPQTMTTQSTYTTQSSPITGTTSTETLVTTPPQTVTMSYPPVVLKVLTRHPGDILQVAKKMFLSSDIAKKYNIVDVQFISVPPGLWVQTAKAQSVDVGWGGGPTLFDTLYQEKLLAPLSSPTLLQAMKDIPDTVAGAPLKRTGPDGNIYWVAAALSSFGFTVNTALAQQYGLPPLKSWRDLASPEVGKILLKAQEPPIGIADPLASTSNTRMYEIILQAYGWDEGWRILTLMGANSFIYSGSSDVRDAVIKGERIAGITIDYYGYTAHYLNPACVYVLPENETIVNGDPIALLSTSKNPVQAQAFIEWVLTDGQKVWLDPNINRIPVNPKVFDTSEGKAREDLKKSFEELFYARGIEFSDELALSYEVMMQYYFKATIIDTQQLLVSAWTKLLSAYYGGKITQEKFNELVGIMTRPIEFTDPETGQKVVWSQDVAIRLNTLYLSGKTTILDGLMKEWRAGAEERYRAVIQALG
jgi:ABC-type Fe3+ transport system substrate-binding protein